ncbi:MAG: hypothetical protein EZS28_019315 [Streblomastix strix]|uniref:TmcB/TmcC TPR repeats domain-containing protein n=1 Tax=Streblomastix strix TaxID=222440 RepID=A0A5J4VSH8_9EUKA|nr:MAG: hypothetical protein EZS28_019315 [Streblomastix strix]
MLRNARRTNPNIIERWIVYALLHEIEVKDGSNNQQGVQIQNKEGGQDGVTYSLRFNEATRYYSYSKAYLTQAFIMLARDNPDLNKIMMYIDYAIVNEKLSKEIFEDLLRRHSNSVQLLRAYGFLLRDIYREDEMALQLINQANDIEMDEKERKNKSLALQKVKV